jgi:hypothetical protein
MPDLAIGDGTLSVYNKGEILPQGSSLRSQPWAMRHNSFGVNPMVNSVTRNACSVLMNMLVDLLGFASLDQELLVI